MFYGRNIEKRVNKSHERAFGLVFDDFKNLSFRDLLLKVKNVSIYQKNLQLLAIKNFQAIKRNVT